MEEQKIEIRRARNRLVVIIGIIAGLIYTVFARGLDAYQLMNAHYILPWLKLLINGLPAVLIISGAAWLAIRIHHVASRTIMWMAAATGLCFLVSFLTFQGAESAYGLFLPAIRTKITYSATAGIQSRLFVIIIMTNILFVLGGLMINSASESVIMSSGVVGWVFPVLFCLAFLTGADYPADSNFNTALREKVLAIDQQLEQVAQLNIDNLSERQERKIRRFSKLEVDMEGPRKLPVASFDESISQARVLINFNVIWAQWLSLNGRVGNCERIEQ